MVYSQNTSLHSLKSRFSSRWFSVLLEKHRSSSTRTICLLPWSGSNLLTSISRSSWLQMQDMEDLADVLIFPQSCWIPPHQQLPACGSQRGWESCLPQKKDSISSLLKCWPLMLAVASESSFILSVQRIKTGTKMWMCRSGRYISRLRRCIQLFLFNLQNKITSTFLFRRVR